MTQKNIRNSKLLYPKNNEKDRSFNNTDPRERLLSDEENQSIDEDPSSSFSDDSMYSFESLIASYDMEPGYEDMQLDLMKPLHQGIYLFASR